jgi:hypothetical protein
VAVFYVLKRVMNGIRIIAVKMSKLLLESQNLILIIDNGLAKISCHGCTSLTHVAESAHGPENALDFRIDLDLGRAE